MSEWYLADMGWAKERAKVARRRGTVIRVRREIELGGESQKALTRNVTTLSGYFSSDLRFSCPQVAGFRATCFPGRQAEYLKMWKAECARARPRVSDPAVQCTVSQPISLLFILSDEPNASDI